MPKLTTSSVRNVVNRPTFVSLFSGCGGLDMGFVQAGFSPIAAFDIWPLALKNYQLNIGPDAEVWDLSNGVLPRKLQCDVVIAGSPCQGFSTVGKRKLDDPRNMLLQSAVEIAISVNPEVMVFENVLGVLQGDHKKYWYQAREKLVSSGYYTDTVIIDARDAGVPQSRKRVFLLACKSSPLNALHIETQKCPSLMEVISDISQCKNHEPKRLELGSTEHSIAERLKPGQKLCNVRGGQAAVHTWDIPEVFGPTTESEREVLLTVMKLRRTLRKRDFGDADPISRRDVYQHLQRKVVDDISSLLRKGYLRDVHGLIDLKHTFNGKYRRALPEGASFTVDTRFGDPKCFLHPVETRAFSVREAARIQGFPDSYVFLGPTRDQFKMIGNAVPPKLSYVIAEAIKKAVFDQVCDDAA